jgi:hypothetical protein
MKKISEFYNNNKIFAIIVILAFFGSLLFVFILPKPPQAIDHNTKILFQSDSLRFQKGISSSHNTILINLLQEREAASDNSIASMESVKMQSRMFYCAIIAGLISLLFTIKKIKRKIILINLLILIIALLYFVDVHQQDLIQRNTNTGIITKNATNQLANSFTDTVTIYVLSYHEQFAQYEKAAEPLGRWFRKAYTAYHPDLPQIVYYILPFVYFLFYSIKLRWSMLYKKVLKIND